MLAQVVGGAQLRQRRGVGGQGALDIGDGEVDIGGIGGLAAADTDVAATATGSDQQRHQGASQQSHSVPHAR